MGSEGSTSKKTGWGNDGASYFGAISSDNNFGGSISTYYDKNKDINDKKEEETKKKKEEKVSEDSDSSSEEDKKKKKKKKKDKKKKEKEESSSDEEEKNDKKKKGKKDKKDKKDKKEKKKNLVVIKVMMKMRIKVKKVAIMKRRKVRIITKKRRIKKIKKKNLLKRTKKTNHQKRKKMMMMTNLITSHPQMLLKLIILLFKLIPIQTKILFSISFHQIMINLSNLLLTITNHKIIISRI